MNNYRDALDGVIEEVVRPQADHVDRTGEYPRRSLDALGDAGILGLTVAEPLGGGGGLADAADVIRALAGACGSTAMVSGIPSIPHQSASAVRG